MKEFNTTGVCVPEMHYMVNISGKLDKIISLIERNKYFTINRARQYGKTTTMSMLFSALKGKYVVVRISFEGLGDGAFVSENEFCESFISLVSNRLKLNRVDREIIEKWEKNKSSLQKFEELSDKITELVKHLNREIILMIDEVDKSSNNQLFLHFLGVLRNKYLDRNEGLDSTFKSVILTGVHDVKNLKLNVRNDDEKKYNSPWNIAANFEVDMSFNPDEISTMLTDYEKDAETGMDIQKISRLLYDYTSGYPFLVSRLCQIIEEKLNRNWSEEGVEEAVKSILNEQNTLFDDIIKNIENNMELGKIVYEILMNGIEFSFVRTDEIINLGITYGLFSESKKSKVKIHNVVFENLLYNHMSIKQERERLEIKKHITSQFINGSGDLDMEQILTKFQELMIEEYRNETEDFVEKEGRLIFLAFIKPIINGTGFYHVESETRSNMRMDIVITFNKKQYIIELKKWYGKAYEETGHDNLVKYLESRNNQRGYMVMFDFRKVKKEYAKKWIELEGKSIYEVVV